MSFRSIALNDNIYLQLREVSKDRNRSMSEMVAELLRVYMMVKKADDPHTVSKYAASIAMVDEMSGSAEDKIAVRAKKEGIEESLLIFKSKVDALFEKEKELLVGFSSLIRETRELPLNVRAALASVNGKSRVMDDIRKERRENLEKLTAEAGENLKDSMETLKDKLDAQRGIGPEANSAGMA